MCMCKTLELTKIFAKKVLRKFCYWISENVKTVLVLDRKNLK